jgi:flagellar protein FliO/FliZ
VKQSKQEQATGGLASVASAPLGAGRAVHLVRAGNELLLVGVADHGVTPLRTYSEQEAQDAGLIDEWGDLILPEAGLEPVAAGTRTGGRLPNPTAVVESIRKWTVRR